METVWLFLFGIYLGFLVSVVYRDVVVVAKYRRNSRVEAIRDLEDRLERLHLMDLRATLEEIGRESVKDEWKEGEDSE